MVNGAQNSPCQASIKKNKEASLNKKNKAQIPELEIPELQIAAWNID